MLPSPPLSCLPPFPYILFTSPQPSLLFPPIPYLSTSLIFPPSLPSPYSSFHFLPSDHHSHTPLSSSYLHHHPLTPPFSSCLHHHPSPSPPPPTPCLDLSRMACKVQLWFVVGKGSISSCNCVETVQYAAYRLENPPRRVYINIQDVSISLVNKGTSFTSQLCIQRWRVRISFHFVSPSLVNYPFRSFSKLFLIFHLFRLFVQ